MGGGTSLGIIPKEIVLLLPLIDEIPPPIYVA